MKRLERARKCTYGTSQLRNYGIVQYESELVSHTVLYDRSLQATHKKMPLKVGLIIESI